MDAERWPSIKATFLALLELDDAERARRLESLRATDPALASDVESLIANAGDDDASWTSFADSPRPTAASTPARIGRFRIVRELGRGGMGIVCLAEQDQPARLVALKLIRPGWMTHEVAARFEREAQCLARLQHPGIAQIYEVGTVGAGDDARPYLAMEYVEGATLLEFARANELDARERLQLIAKVCDAVQHAHQRGVIHRDLKPSNILVGADGQPKVLDFGVARAVDAEPGRVTALTEFGRPIGTLPYMSPEQLGGDASELDTRSDVYALGVVTFELLGGALPFDVRGKLALEAARVIREDAPTKLASLAPQIERDVEIVVGKALEKDKERRYESAAALAVDIGRCLRNEPIDARPPSALYVASKWARRNRALCAGLAVAALALVVGLAGTSWQAVRAARGERLAKTSSLQAAAARDFFRDLFVSVDPERDGAQVRVIDLLERAPSDIEKRFATDPETRAWLYGAIGEALISLEEYERALAPLERALEGWRSLGRDETREALAAHGYWAEALHGAARLDEAGRALEENLEKRRRVLGELDDDTLGALQCYITWLEHVGRDADASARAREAVKLVESAKGADDEWTIAFKSTLAMSLSGKVQHVEGAERAALEGEALPLLEAVVAWRRKHEPDAPATLTALHNLAQTYWRLDRFDDAEPLLRESVAGLERTLGPGAPGTMIATGTLGSLLQSARRFDEARATYERAHAGLCATWGARHPEALVLAYNLAYLERDRGRLEEAERWAREAAEGRREVLGPDNALAMRATWQHAEILRELGRRSEAREIYEGLLATARDSLAPDDQRIEVYRRGYDACAAP